MPPCSVVYGGVEAEFVGEPGAFLGTAGCAHDPTTRDLCDLTRNRAYGAGGAGNEHRLAGTRTSDIEHPEIGREARNPEHAENVLGRMTFVVLCQSGGRQRNIFLPPELSTDPISGLEFWRLGLNDFAEAPSRHDVSGFEHGAIRAAGHPRAARGINRQKGGTDKDLSRAGLRHGGFAQLEMFGSHIASGLPHVDPLPVFRHVIFPGATDRGLVAGCVSGLD